MGRIIYGYKDPRNNKFRYVGNTTVLPERRLQMHLSNRAEKRNYNHPKNIWLRELMSLGLKPEIIIFQELGEMSEMDGNIIEANWIMKLLDEGHDLTNLCSNGITKLLQTRKKELAI